MAVSEFPAPPVGSDDPEFHRRQIADSVNNLMTGKMNNVLDVTLGASSASTTITDARIGVNTALLLVRQRLTHRLKSAMELFMLSQHQE